MNNFQTLPTQNPEHGFWGTSKSNGHDVDMTWNAVSQILSSEFELTPEQTRDLLDNRFGRHLADDLSFIKDGPTTPGIIYEHIRERLADLNWRETYEEAVQFVKPELKRNRAELMTKLRDMELAQIATKHFKSSPESYNTRYPADVEFHFSADEPLTMLDVKDALEAAYAAGMKMGRNRKAR